ncbi:MAG TPA: 3-isopropylmalate dehydratase small subunit [Blastocatellia bacterium]|nr:3-isopropylmalate dehydratase small subunit [Blastocatellia bacterium]
MAELPSNLKGSAHVYERAHINTDEIIPARYLNVHEESELAKHAMEDIDADFIKRVRSGDFVIAGDDFGCGSSREHAIWALRGAGIKVVIARSYARIFFRNAINNGFLAIECPEAVEIVKTGDQIELDLKAGTMRNLSSGQTVNFVPLTEFARELIEDGGLLPHIQKKAKAV